MAERILIIDFGSQVTQLIARRVREAGVYCEIAPFTLALAAFHRMRPKGIILSGGPNSVYEDDAPQETESSKNYITQASLPKQNADSLPLWRDELPE